MMNSKKHAISGILFKMANLLTFSVMSIIIKISIGHLHSYQLLFLLNIGCLIITTSTLLLKKRNIVSAITVNRFSVSRSVAFTGGTILWVLAIGSLPITEATAISYLTPLMMALLGISFLGEKLTKQIVLALLLGIAGMIIILKPFTNDVFFPGLAFALLSALMWAIHDVIIKFQTNKSEPWFEQIHTLCFLVSLLISPFAIYNWEPIEPKYILICLSLAPLTILNKFFLISAISRSKLVNLAPISFVRIIFTAILAYLIFGEIMEYDSILGVIVIILSTSLVVKHTSKMYGGSGKS